MLMTSTPRPRGDLAPAHAHMPAHRSDIGTTSAFYAIIARLADTTQILRRRVSVGRASWLEVLGYRLALIALVCGSPACWGLILLLIGRQRQDLVLMLEGVALINVGISLTVAVAWTCTHLLRRSRA